ncbi:MAG TPA: chromosomal replication initiator protein DnaA [Actinomycetota bacterium]|jgi:chromosomal replication initiator protein
MSVAAFEPTAQEVWSRVVERAREELPDGSFNMWFSRVRAARLGDGVLSLEVPTDYVRDWLSRNYLGLIRDASQDAVGHPVRIEITSAGLAEPPNDAAWTDAETSAEPRPVVEDVHPAVARPGGDRRDLPGLGGFPDRYTFDTFVPGQSNRFAHAAAMAVAEAPPAKAYNPLFIYGGVGLGKTHLLYAIGHYMTQLNAGMRCKYVTSETFVTEFIKAVRERQAYQFQRKYRDVDLLMVDDIQFLVRAEETQQEFFHTFNFLYASNRQIVIASDRPPQDLQGMAERLINRFRCGLSVDVQPPDLETRIAILQLKAKRDHIDVPFDVVTLIASKFDQNIRELEGALLRVAAFGSLLRQPITPELADQALADLIPQSDREIPVDLILSETAAYFQLTRADLIGKSRSRPLTNARHVAMYLVRECTGLSLLKIGELFERDHTTVMHGLKKVETLMGERGGLYRQVQDLTRRIRTEAQGGPGK